MNLNQAHNTENSIFNENSGREASVRHIVITDGPSIVCAWLVNTHNLFKNIKRNPE